MVNLEEAERVRAIFALFLERGSLPPVVRELEARGWFNKRWRTRSGREGGGQPFTRVGLRRLLSNVPYVGQVRYREESHDGEQPPPAVPSGRVPRVARLLALAHRLDGLLRAAVVRDYAELARLGHVTRARVGQVMARIAVGPGPPGADPVPASGRAGPRPGDPARPAADRCDGGLASAATLVGMLPAWRPARGGRPARLVAPTPAATRL